jgi:hypothetical protein
MSDSKSGANNPMYGKVPANAFQTGANNPMCGRTGALNPMYGKVPANAFQSGANHPMYGKVPANAFQSGANHPMYGVTPANAMTINVYSLDGTLINSFSSQVAAAEWLSVNHSTISRYIKSGKVFQNQYLFRKSVL